MESQDGPDLAGAAGPDAPDNLSDQGTIAATPPMRPTKGTTETPAEDAQALMEPTDDESLEPRADEAAPGPTTKMEKKKGDKRGKKGQKKQRERERQEG